MYLNRLNQSLHSVQPTGESDLAPADAGLAHLIKLLQSFVVHTQYNICHTLVFKGDSGTQGQKETFNVVATTGVTCCLAVI